MIDPFSVSVGVALSTVAVIAAAAWRTVHEPSTTAPPGDCPNKVPAAAWNGLDYCAHPDHDPSLPEPALYEQVTVGAVADLDITPGDGGTWCAVTWCAAHAPPDARPIR